MKIYFFKFCLVICSVLILNSNVYADFDLTDPLNIFDLIQEVLNEEELRNDAELRGSYDLLLGLLPLYGGIKVGKLVVPYSYDKVKSYFIDNPKIYLTFKNELATEGIFLPDLNKMNWDVITKEDYDIAKTIIGTTTIKQAITPEFVAYIKAHLEAHPELIQRLEERAKQAGITYNSVIDVKEVIKSLERAFIPNIASFLPTAMKILIFGRK